MHLTNSPSPISQRTGLISKRLAKPSWWARFKAGTGGLGSPELKFKPDRSTGNFRTGYVGQKWRETLQAGRHKRKLLLGRNQGPF